MSGVRVPEISLPWIPRAVRVTPVDFDNMQPTMRKGDFVLAVPTDHFEVEGCYLFADGCLYRCQPAGKDVLWLLSDNKLYSKNEVTKAWFDENVTAYVVAHIRVIDRRFLHQDALTG